MKIKTEQEQLQEIKRIIDERVETNLGQVHGYHGNVMKTVDTIIIAKDILEAGYGDVREYKAELDKRMDSYNDECLLNYHLQDDLDKARAQLKTQKQAQIDVLNELKARASQSTFWENGYIPVRYFRELVKEVQAE